MINIGGNFTARGRENCTKRAVLLLLSLILLMSFLHFSVAEESKGNETVLASLQLDRTEIQLQKGYRTQIHATVLNLPKGVRASKYEWTTSDDMVATIRNGSVKGVGGGNAELTCTATLTDGTVLTAACEVYVTVPVNELKATNRFITIMAGDTYIPEIQVLPEDATNKAYLLSSGNEQILTVDADGQITAQAEGKTTLTATSEDQPDKSVPVPGVDQEHSLVQGTGRGNFFLQGGGITDDECLLRIRMEDLADGGRPLDAQGGFVIAPFNALTGLRQEEYAVAFQDVIQVGRTVFRGFPCGEDDQMDAFLGGLGQDGPAGGQEKPAAKRFLRRFDFVLQQPYRLGTYQHFYFFSVDNLFISLLKTLFLPWRKKPGWFFHRKPTFQTQDFNSVIYS